jgi:SpoVK/Ycf46/Vps4 family AAA+-type ATPase
MFSSQFRKIEFPPPNEEARLDILKIHSRKMNLTRYIQTSFYRDGRSAPVAIPAALWFRIQATLKNLNIWVTFTNEW